MLLYTCNKMNKRLVGVGVCGVLLLVIAIFSIQYLAPTSATTPIPEEFAENSNPPISELNHPDEGVSIAQPSDIEVLLRNVPAQFITYPSQGQNPTASLSPELQKIAAFAGHVLLGNEYAPDKAHEGRSVDLIGVGQRYIVAAVLSPKDTGSRANIIDSKTLSVSPLPGDIWIYSENTAVIVGDDDTIYTYKLGAAAAEAVPGTTLPKNESYDHCLRGCLGTNVTETHSTTTATFTVWQWSKEEEASFKSREITFSF